jgi:pimeloyl-ACP methyl ester carboxylesterase
MKTSDKTFFIISGFKTQVTKSEYEWLITYLEGKGVRVIKVPVKWNRHTLTENANEFISYFNAFKSKENYVLGFSYGAVITLLTANILKPKKVFLCSLSPAFKEDSESEDSSLIHYIGKKRFADLSTYYAKTLAKNLQIQSVVFYGEKEGDMYPKLKKRCEDTAQLAHNSRLVVVKDASHQIHFSTYQEAVKKAIGF